MMVSFLEALFPGDILPLMEEILPQLVGSFSHYLQGFSTIPGGYPDFWTINSSFREGN